MNGRLGARVVKLERRYRAGEGEGANPTWPEPFKTLAECYPEAARAFRVLLAHGRPPERPWLFEASATAPERVRRAQEVLAGCYDALMEQARATLVEHFGSREAAVEALNRRDPDVFVPSDSSEQGAQRPQGPGPLGRHRFPY